MISKEQFLLRQPAFPEETSTDYYYYNLANRLVEEASEKGLFPSYPEKVVERCALAVIGYFQDVICDAGIWRSFITECRRLYGHTLPFYDGSEEDYMDYELNRSDVRFMVWYGLCMNYEERRVCNPYNQEILSGADAWWELLESVYDESPLPEDYHLAHELEMHAAEDREALFRLGNWLFMHCYLMTPAYAMTLSEIAAGCDMTTEEGIIELKEKMERSMGEDPTGPLALYLGEWMYLIVDGKLPKSRTAENEGEIHKFYTSFTKATKGEIIKFFSDYGSLNRFFIEALGWTAGEEHLSNLKGERDFILMVDPHKGMLLAKNIARCIAMPGNMLYDPEYASVHAIELLTERGCCPGDLLKYVCENGWLPDARFSGDRGREAVADNWDFIARCYLQQYYRGD